MPEPTRYYAGFALLLITEVELEVEVDVEIYISHSGMNTMPKMLSFDFKLVSAGFEPLATSAGFGPPRD